MRLCISLNAEKQPLTLPVHYNHYVQAAIYSSISADLADFLHEKGYTYQNRRFKFFTFSRLLGKYKINAQNKTIDFFGPVKLYVSSPINEFCTSIMGCILGEGRIRLADQLPEVSSIAVDNPTVTGSEADFNLLSPVVTYSTFAKPTGGKYTCYYHPGEREFAQHIKENLRKKYAAYYKEIYPEKEVAVQLLNQPRLNVNIYKKTIIKGYTCKLRLYGPQKLLQVAVDAGLGAKNSQGFGFVQLLDYH